MNHSRSLDIFAVLADNKAMDDTKGKRRHGQGSIRKKSVVNERRKIYKWELRVSVRDATGVMVQRSHTVEGTESTANKLLAELNVDGRRVGMTDGKNTVGDALTAWLEDRELHISEGAMRRYKGTAERHVAPRWGKIRLRDVTKASVKSWYTELRKPKVLKDGKKKNGLGFSSVRMVHTVLSGALNYAVECQVLLSSPLTGRMIETPLAEKNKRASVGALDRKQATAFYKTAIADRGGAPLAFCLLTGVRIGEALALKWGAVNLETGDVRIELTRSGGEKGGVYENAPKSTAGNRVIPCAGQTMELLRSQKIRLEQERAANLPGWVDSEYVFFNLRGGPYRPDAPKRYMARICKAAGLERINIHRLRHTAATILLSEGGNLSAVSKHLGHSKASITLDVYRSVLPHELVGLTLDF